MTDTITITGVVGTEPASFQTSGGVPMVSFRLASSHRYLDRKTQEWVDSPANWYTVQAYRQLADNVRGSVHKGESVIVTGRLRVRTWTKEERSGIAVDVDADAIGHNLVLGVSRFTRVKTSVESPAGSESSNDAEDGDAWATVSPSDGSQASLEHALA